MMRTGATTTVAVVETETTVDGAVDTTMTAEQLLVSLDVALRDNRHQIVNTVLAILAKAEGDSVKKFEYICQIILIAFKRRNHEKSQAPGTGSGEKDILRTILLAMYVVAPDAVKAVLPLVPLYGSWKDLNLVAERYMDSLPEDSLDSGEMPELCVIIANLFADQMSRDKAAIEAVSSSTDSDTMSKTDAGFARVVLPSSASKYTFSEARHRGSKTNRKAAKASRAHKIQSKLADMVATRLLSKGLGAGMTLQKRELRPLYRKYVAGLRAQLATNGFMIEHHICNKTSKLINFTRAPKGSLTKYTVAINKDPVAKAKWLQAAKKSQTAVPDINELREAAQQAVQEESFHTEEKMLGRRIIKGIASMQEAREKLIATTQALVDQLTLGTDRIASKKGLEDAMEAAASGVVYPMVDTFGCTSQSDVDTLLMAAYIVARSQNGGMICFNGHLIRLDTRSPPENAMDTADSAAPVADIASAATTSSSDKKRPALVTNTDIERAMEWYTSFDQRLHGWQATRTGEAVAQDLQAGGVQILAAVEDPSAAVPRDLMLLAIALPADTTALSAAVDALQTPTPSTSSTSSAGSFRSVLVHKVKAELLVGGKIDFKLRTHGKSLLPIEEMRIDVCILMDFTGSMGSWMSAAKNHLTTIIRSLREETRAREVRIAFVGYRDYQDTGRVVIKDFVTSDRADEVIASIQGQHASGGGDIPEDVLIGVNAVNNLAWRGDIRVCLHIADATAHGYTKYCSGHDNYPTGLCPDQKGMSLEGSLRKMAEENLVDMMFCDCNNYSTKDLKELYHSIYQGDGFGVLPLQNASGFKDQILGALSTAVLDLHVQESVSGLQSFAGNTLSAIISTMNTSLRESLLAVSAEVEALQIEETETESEMEAVESVTSAVSDVKMETGDEAAAAAEAEAEAESAEPEEESTSEAGKTPESEEVRSKPEPKCKPAARTDYQRLVSELESQDLAPVRLLLGMPVASSLAMSAGKTLIDSGLTVADLQTMGYPASIVQVFVEAAAVSIKSI